MQPAGEDNAQQTQTNQYQETPEPLVEVGVRHSTQMPHERGDHIPEKPVMIRAKKHAR